MFPFGHLGFTFAAREAFGRQLPAAPWWALAVGAMLPDIVDKPLGHLALDMGSGRLWGHTVLFALILAAAAYGARRTSAGPALAAVAFGAGMHLALDRMWELPEVLLWPALGLGMPTGDFQPIQWVESLLTDPYVQVTEVLGILLLAGVTWRRRRALRA